MHVVVPFAADRPKTRLADTLDTDERREFADAMLRDVLAALDAVPRSLEVTVLSTGPVDGVDAAIEIDERPLTPAVNDRLGTAPTAVVMADLALATLDAVTELFGL
ncbi:2-phospho-L-lactate guanylyltransferase, partial [Halolamina salina]